MRALFPTVKITAYYTAAALLNESPGEIRNHLAQMEEALQDNFVIFGSSIDVQTPAENRTAFLEYADELNRR